MARKSRKQTGMAKTDTVNTTMRLEQKAVSIPTAAYVRLSTENGGRGDVDTVKTQLTLVQEYIEVHPELELRETYIDNGFSGTNFERPAFLSMIEDIRKGKIKCVVVKDLSRFGRNYLETGYFIESVFPFLGVRLIAVTDHFDSSREEDVRGLSVPIKNLVNDLYAKDISRKIWSANQQLKRQGKSCGNCAPYGYIRNKETGRNEIDWNVAHFVQMMYQWALLGCSFSEIGKRLDLLGAPTPRTRAHQLGFSHEPKNVVWQNESVRWILTNRAYIGDTITNKTNQAYFAGEKKKILPESEWIITEGTHEPLIAADDYEAVQELIRKKSELIRKRKAEAIPADEKDLLKRLVYCADCGNSMQYDRLPHERLAVKRTAYYVCQGIGTHCSCRGHSITAEYLKKQVMDVVTGYIRNFCNREEFLKQLVTKNEYPPLKELRKTVDRLKKQEGELTEKKEKLYEDFAVGILDADEYEYIKKNYGEGLGKVKRELAEAKKQLEALNAAWVKYENWARRWEGILSDDVALPFEEDVVRELIEKIKVSANGQVEIVFRFQDEFRGFIED